ncbi:MAG: ParB/RepB/Spo0J family partition protein [Eubacterium sp.]|nr:ParB/RepB/Spo0J family partition protein [Eubacterium sp.]
MSKSPRGRGLGRGLDALFAEQQPIIERAREKSETAADSNEGAVIYIDINSIKPNRNQPRKVFDPEKIAELADSIKEHGIIQPLVLRTDGEGLYEIVAGERRWRAAREAGLTKVPGIVREFTDEENALIAIIENMQREDLNPIEEAEGLNQMIKTYGLTQEEVSKSVSKSRPYISNALRLLKLPQDIQDLCSEGVLSAGHARALAGVKDEKLQAAICRKARTEGLSVREVEKLVSGGGSKRRKPVKRVKNADTIRVENELKELYGTKVSINQNGKKGSIELEFYSMDELNRLIDLLRAVQ